MFLNVESSCCKDLSGSDCERLAKVPPAWGTCRLWLWVTGRGMPQGDGDGSDDGLSSGISPLVWYFAATHAVSLYPPDKSSS